MADARVTAYFKDPKTGETKEEILFPVDANYAVGQFPDQWKLTPWDEPAVDPAPASKVSAKS